MKRKEIVWLTLFLPFLLIGCDHTQPASMEPAESSFFAMNTYMTFRAYGENADTALMEAHQLIQDVEALWSVTEEGSEITRANHSEGEPVRIDERTAELISFSLEMAERTEGALEPTLYPVLSAWGFTTDSKQVPEPSEIEQLLKTVGYERIFLQGNTLTVPAGMQLDLGAVAKGYAADLVEETFRAHGVESAMVSLGGNIQAIGSRPDGSDWRIGIRAPNENGTLGVLRISSAAVVTSGGYENYFEGEDGKLYWHILDPATGYPAQNGLVSATAVSPEGKLSDALSTALFVMGPERAEQYWREQGGFEMLLITDQNEVLITEGIADRFSLNEGRRETTMVVRR